MDKGKRGPTCVPGGLLSAKVTGGAAEVTGVDLDEEAIAQAKRMRTSTRRVEWVHCDAFLGAADAPERGD
jgi:23S rRNA (cytosine1962-C5)-methyltransferase